MIWLSVAPVLILGECVAILAFVGGYGIYA